MSLRHNSDATTPQPTGPPPAGYPVIESTASSSAPTPSDPRGNRTEDSSSPLAVVRAACGAVIESLRYIFSRRPRKGRDG